MRRMTIWPWTVDFARPSFSARSAKPSGGAFAAIHSLMTAGTGLSAGLFVAPGVAKKAMKLLEA